MKFKPHAYQERCIRFILDHPAAGLFLDMGLGKTVITLTAISALLDTFEVSRVLVIAPLRVAEDTWTREAAKWDHLKGLRIARVLGSKHQRIAALREDADVYVVNRENVPWLVRTLGPDWFFDMIVIDELSSFKNPQSLRFKMLRKMRPFASRVVGLTGTPASNSLLDLWSEIYLLDMGERLGKFVTHYRNAYFRPSYISPQGAVYSYVPRHGAMEQITARIADITISMKASDYIELPDQIETDIFVELPDPAKRIYRKMEKDMLVELDGEGVCALSAAACVAKLGQMANGFAYGEDKNQHPIHTAKLDALREIVEQAAESGESVLVFYEYVHDADTINEALHKQVIIRQLQSEIDIVLWNRGEIGVLLAHPASVGYGLNLQQGGHVIVWYGLTWSLEQYLQANARLHRQGQEKPVVVYRILAKGTVDEQIAASLTRKDTTQNAVLEILKQRREARI